MNKAQFKVIWREVRLLASDGWHTDRILAYMGENSAIQCFRARQGHDMILLEATPEVERRKRVVEIQRTYRWYRG